MSESFSSALLIAVAAYAGAGLLFASAFLVAGIERIDPAARGSSAGFRLLVLPGVVALWPLLARRWWSGASAAPEESDAHVRAARDGGEA